MLAKAQTLIASFPGALGNYQERLGTRAKTLNVSSEPLPTILGVHTYIHTYAYGHNVVITEVREESNAVFLVMP